jgi:hypothetical protein
MSRGPDAAEAPEAALDEDTLAHMSVEELMAAVDEREHHWQRVRAQRADRARAQSEANEEGKEGGQVKDGMIAKAGTEGGKGDEEEEKKREGREGIDKVVEHAGSKRSAPEGTGENVSVAEGSRKRRRPDSVVRSATEETARATPLKFGANFEERMTPPPLAQGAMPRLDPLNAWYLVGGIPAFSFGTSVFRRRKADRAAPSRAPSSAAAVTSPLLPSATPPTAPPTAVEPSPSADVSSILERVRQVRARAARTSHDALETMKRPGPQ